MIARLGIGALVAVPLTLVACTRPRAQRPERTFACRQDHRGAAYSSRRHISRALQGECLVLQLHGHSVTGVDGASGSLVSVLSGAKLQLQFGSRVAAEVSGSWAVSDGDAGTAITEFGGKSGRAVRTLTLGETINAGVLSGWREEISGSTIRPPVGQWCSSSVSPTEHPFVPSPRTWWQHQPRSEWRMACFGSRI